MSRLRARTACAPVSAAGVSAVELLITSALVATLAVPALAMLGAGLGQVRAESAARHLAQWLATARAHALSSGRAAAVRFDEMPAPGGCELSRHARVGDPRAGDSHAGDARSGCAIRMQRMLDGNGNGLRTIDLSLGIDHPVGPAVALGDLVPGARFGIAADAPAIDGGPGLTRGGDPIRFGRSRLASFSPRGTSTPGTVYIRGPDDEQYAVRVLGATGRIRVLHFDPVRRLWRTR